MPNEPLRETTAGGVKTKLVLPQSMGLTADSPVEFGFFGPRIF
jgi:hypothetical protein